MRMGNPSLRRWVSKSRNGELSSDVEPSTYKGIYGKAAIYALITIVCAIVTEIVVIALMNEALVEALMGVIFGMVACGIVLLIISLVIAFAPSTVKVLGFVYCVLQGGLLGCLTLIVDIFIAPGISVAALLGTGIVFLVSVAVNKLLEVKISSRFMRGLMVAFVSIALVQLVMWALSLAGVFDYTAYLWVQIIASTLCIIWATIMLTWDLQNIDFIVQGGLDKQHEWNVAFSLVTTLVYLYLEILELLLRIVMLFKNKNK